MGKVPKVNFINANTKATTVDKEEAVNNFKSDKSIHRNLLRKHKVSQEIDKDNKPLNLLSKQPKDIFKAFKNANSSQTEKLKSLQVGNKIYSEENIADGLYDSISELKTLPEITATAFERF